MKMNMPGPETSRPRVVIADSEDLTRHGIAHVLTKARGFAVTEARSSEDIRLKLKHPLPDLFIVDHNSVDGFTTEDLVAIRHQYEKLPIIVITSNHQKKVILKLLEIGVHGFLFKDCTEQELTRCVEAMLRGERFFCNEVFDILMEARLSRPGSEQWPSQLTSREVDVIRLIVKGHSTSVIASELNLSHHTISTHRKNIIRKLKIKTQAELVAKAYDLGLVAKEE